MSNAAPWKETADLPDEFFSEGVAMCARHRWNFEHLLAVMLNESDVRPHEPNHADRAHGAVGLIQFMPNIAYWVMNPSKLSVASSSPEAQAARLRMQSLDAVAQLPYVERFFSTWSSAGLTSTGRFYQATFLPGTLSTVMDPDAPLCRVDDPSPVLRSAYVSNRSFDIDRKGYITISDLDRWIQKAQARSPGRWAELVTRSRAAGSSPSSGGGSSFGGFAAGVCFLALLFGGGWFFLKG